MRLLIRKIKRLFRRRDDAASARYFVGREIALRQKTDTFWGL